MHARATGTGVTCCLVAATLAPVAATDQPKIAKRRFALTAWDAAAVERARAGAVRRLQEPACRQIFRDFRDRDGRTIQHSLDGWGMTAAEYLRMIPFLDGSSVQPCRRTRVALAATPGVSRVYVCPAFADIQMRQPRMAETLVIHEMLHTLGLGEDPPSSQQISQRIESSCR